MKGMLRLEPRISRSWAALAASVGVVLSTGASAEIGQIWSVEFGETPLEARALDSGGRLLAREVRAAAWWREAIGGVLEARVFDEVGGTAPLAVSADLGLGWRLADGPGSTLDMVAGARWNAVESPDQTDGLVPAEDPLPIAGLRARWELARGLRVDLRGEVGDAGDGPFWGVRAGADVDLGSGWSLRADVSVLEDSTSLGRALDGGEGPADRAGIWLGVSKAF